MTYDRRISSHDIARKLNAQRTQQMSDAIGAFLRRVFVSKPALRPLMG